MCTFRLLHCGHNARRPTMAKVLVAVRFRLLQRERLGMQKQRVRVAEVQARQLTKPLWDGGGYSRIVPSAFLLPLCMRRLLVIFCFDLISLSARLVGYSIRPTGTRCIFPNEWRSARPACRGQSLRCSPVTIVGAETRGSAQLQCGSPFLACLSRGRLWAERCQFVPPRVY